MVPRHVQPVGRSVALGCIMHLCYEGCEDMGQHMGYRSLEWNWPTEAMNRPIGAGVVAVLTF